jgi:hypothetical protein
MIGMLKTLFLPHFIVVGLVACSPVDTEKTSSVRPATIARAEVKSKGEHFAMREFDKIDIGKKGHLDTRNIENYRTNIFIAMDIDGSNDLALGEFPDINYGFFEAADKTNRRSAYDTALKIIFSLYRTLWGRDWAKRVLAPDHPTYRFLRLVLPRHSAKRRPQLIV